MNQTHTLSLNDGSGIQCNIKSLNLSKREIHLEVLKNEAFAHFAKHCHTFHLFDNQLQIIVNESDREVLLSGLFYQGFSSNSHGDIILSFYITGYKVAVPDGNLNFYIPLKFEHKAYFDNSNDTFDFNGKSWSLRNSILDSGDEVYRKAFLPHSDDTVNCKELLLSTKLLPNEDFNAVKKDAFSICLLMSVALGARIMWSYSWCVIQDGAIFTGYSNKCTNTHPRAEYLVQNAPCNFRKLALGSFVAGIPASYFDNSEWLNYIICWFLNITEVEAIEVKVMICAMLIEHISRKLITNKSYIIGEKLTEALKTGSTKNKLKLKFNELLSFEPNWTQNHTNAIFDRIQQMNSELSYIASIDSLMMQAGRHKLTSNEKKILRARNSIVHQGSLFKSTIVEEHNRDDVFDIYEYFINTCRALVLYLLGYSGRFSVLDRNDGDKSCKVSDFFPDSLLSQGNHINIV